jgi:Peptidase inhibitor family I36
MLRVKITCAIGAMMLAALGVIATAAPANASWSQCPSGALCAYVHPNGGGAPGPVWGNNRNLHQYAKFNNAESLYNHGRQCHVRIYHGLGYTGPSYVLHRGYVNGTLAGTVWWHHVHSNKWCA